MLVSDLDARHDSYDEKGWEENCALYEGGKPFRKIIGRFLKKNLREHGDQYERRKDEATYRPYIGSIVDYYAAWLFSGSFDVKMAGSDGEPAAGEEDTFYAKWKEDVGGDCDLKDFAKEAFKKACVNDKAFWLVQFPGNRPDQAAVDKMSRAEFERLGLDKATLKALEIGQIYDWECDDEGGLLWVMIHDLKKVRMNPRLGPRAEFIETWWLYEPTSVETFQIHYAQDKRPLSTTDIAGDGGKPHGAQQIPLVSMRMPKGCCILERGKEAAIKEFRIAAALDWNIKQTCYASLVIKKDGDDPIAPPGAGYGVRIGSLDDISWVAPPVDHLTVTATEKDSAREEIFRVTHQMAMTVSNQTAAAVGRSGESKEQDSLSTRVMLNTFGGVVKKALEETYEILSDGRGDTDLIFSIEGLDAFDTEAVAVLLTNIAEADLLDIPSKTLKQETRTRAALALVPDADQTVKAAIRQEIKDGVEAMAVHEALMISDPVLRQGAVPEPILSGGKAKPKALPPMPPAGLKKTFPK